MAQDPASQFFGSLIGGDNQVGFFGGGHYRPDQQNFTLPDYQQTTQNYQGLANQAIGLQTPMRDMTEAERMQQAQRAMLDVAHGRMGSDEGVTAIQRAYSPSTQIAAGPAVQTGPNFRQGQGQLIQSLQDTIAGKNPSVAQQQLQQSTDRNIANAYAMSAGNNPAMMRQAMMRGSDLNQQGAGQGALLRAQELQNAQGMLGGVLGQGRGQDTAASLGYLGQNLQAQGMQQQGNQAYEGANFQGFQNAQQNAMGGKILNAAAQMGTAMINPLSGGGGINAFSGGAPVSGGGAPGPWSGGYGAPSGGGGGYMMGPTGVQAYAKGGPVESVMGDRMCAGCGHRNSECICGSRMMSTGGMVPGYARGGNLDSNDTVPAMLSPREVVLPRTVTLADDAPERAKAFMAAIQAKRAKKAA